MTTDRHEMKKSDSGESASSISPEMASISTAGAAGGRVENHDQTISR
jgi:hypothetical protein